MDLERLRSAAKDSSRVQGLTHRFYRYPARFSPQFAKAAIEVFSRRGETVLDPFMGGGTTIVEALANDRLAIGSDINSLSLFVTQVKTTPLDRSEQEEVAAWSRSVAARMVYRHPTHELESLLTDDRTGNLHLPSVRSIKKAIAIALAAIEELSTSAARDFARGVILRTGQWALDNRSRSTTMGEFRQQFVEDCKAMVLQLLATPFATRPTLLNCQADQLPESRPFRDGRRADLVVTSPPYPGIHMLYHRWQVDGRRETAAPYWIADCTDGEGGSHYTLGDRKEAGLRTYFLRLGIAMKAIRSVLKPGGRIVQMVAFSDKSVQLPRYLTEMEAAGFSELRRESGRPYRIWRPVPNRKWHANSKGGTQSAREVVLVHRAE